MRVGRSHKRRQIAHKNVAKKFGREYKTRYTVNNNVDNSCCAFITFFFSAFKQTKKDGQVRADPAPSSRIPPHKFEPSH